MEIAGEVVAMGGDRRRSRGSGQIAGEAAAAEIADTAQAQ